MSGRAGGLVIPGPAGAPIGMVPVHDGMIKAELDAGVVAGLGQLLERVALEGGGLDAPIGLVGPEHAEAVVVFGGDDDVFHAGILGQAHPFLGVELHRVELAGELLVLGDGHLGFLEEPFAVVGVAVPLAGGHGIDAPVNEQAEAGLAEPGHALVALGGRFGGLGNEGGGDEGQCGQEERGFHRAAEAQPSC